MPRTRSTAPTTAPLRPKCSRNGEIRGAVPSPQNHALVPGPDALEHGARTRLQCGELGRRRALAGHAGGLAGQPPCDRLVEDVVRRGAGHQRPAPPDEQVTVADADVELVRIAAELVLQCLDAATSLVAADVARGVVLHEAAGHGHEVEPVGDVVRTQLDAEGGRLERAAPAEDGGRVVPEHRQVGDVAAGRHAVGDGVRQAAYAAAGETVHGGRGRRLQRRPAAEGGLRLVGHAVGDEEDALAHQLPSSARPGRRRHGARLVRGSVTPSRPAPSSATARARRTWGDSARCRSSGPRRRPSWSRRPRRSAPSRSGRPAARPCGPSGP